jgi:DNA-3-methyladenine glycosylase
MTLGKKRLQRAFFAQPTLDVARQLIGCTLVRVEKRNGSIRRIAGIITETEAYCGEEDLACHARAGRTRRTAVMYGSPGHAYVYFTYGNHWMLCIVTQAEEQPHAILVRAIQPTEGIGLIARRRRGRRPADWTNGPGKVTQALSINGRQNGLDLTDPAAIIFVEPGQAIADERVLIGPRVGLGATPEPWLSKPWRFLASPATKCLRQ